MLLQTNIHVNFDVRTHAEKLYIEEERDVVRHAALSAAHNVKSCKYFCILRCSIALFEGFILRIYESGKSPVVFFLIKTINFIFILDLKSE